MTSRMGSMGAESSVGMEECTPSLENPTEPGERPQLPALASPSFDPLLSPAPADPVVEEIFSIDTEVILPQEAIDPPASGVAAEQPPVAEQPPAVAQTAVAEQPLYTFWENITHNKTESVHFLG